MKVDEQKYYALFSTSSQTIAAFVAFLVTGFAIVLNMMDSLQQKDETLAELHGRIKAEYYRKIFWLAVISGIAIILSLSMIYVNGTQWKFKEELFVITAFFDVVAICLAILFIINIINPNKYTIAARELINEEKQEFSPADGNILQVHFMNAFADLEKKLRTIIKRLKLPAEGEREKTDSFRQMVGSLFEHEMLSKEELYELLQINKYRNLVFHGHLETVNRSMLDRIQNASALLDRTLDNTIASE